MMRRLRSYFGGRDDQSHAQWQQAGDAAEAAAATFDSARPMLRVALRSRSQLPPGDVYRAGLAQEIVELLALDAGNSMRFVSQRLAASWAVPLEGVWDAAEEVSLEQPVTIETRAHVGSRVIAIEVDDGTPCIGPFVRHLEKIRRDAVGPLGTLVGVPSGSGCFLLALSQYESLRADAVDLAFLTHEVGSDPRGLARFPIWRAPDGTVRPVSFDIASDGHLVGSYDPAFEGVLTALDPDAELPVPDWATALDGPSYTSFAGWAAAVSGVHPREIDASRLPLEPLLDAWRAADDEGTRFASMSGVLSRRSVEEIPRHGHAAALLGGRDDGRLAAALTDAGLGHSQALDFLRIVRSEVANLSDPGAVYGQLTPRYLYDMARMCASRPVEDWPTVVAVDLEGRVAETAEVAELERADYSVARSRLWIYLVREPSGQEHEGLGLTVREPVPGTFALLAVHGRGRRSRPVRAEMLERWGVEAEAAWTDAEVNVSSAPMVREPWPDPDSPAQLIRTPERESEAVGLLLHRLPSASRTGHLVAVPFRSAAIYLRLEQVKSLNDVQALTTLAAGAYRRATEFDDHLCAQLIWLGPTGAAKPVCDLFRPPSHPRELPDDFLAAIGNAGVPHS